MVRPSSALLAVFAALVAIALWNARSYPPGRGYDAPHHIRYADLLIHHGEFPTRAAGPSEADTPPGYYAVAGAATWVGEKIGLGEPKRLALALNVVLVAITAFLVLELARLLFPARPWAWLAAVAYFGFVPVVLKTAAMFHPEVLNLCLSTIALVLAARMIAERAFSWPRALALGIVCGAELLTRRAALFTIAAILLAFAFLVLVAWAPRLRIVVAGAVVAVVAAAMYAPWWVHVHDLAPPPPGPPNKLVIRPANFATSLGLPAVVADPWRPHYTNRVWPMTYTEIWGDYFGAYAWDPPPPPSSSDERQLVAQSVLGILPTILSVAGWILLVGLAVTRARELLPLALLPATALAGFVWYTAHDLAPDGDVIKATYILTTAPAWAVGFAYAVGRLPRAAALPVTLVLALSLLVDVRFLVYGTPLGFL